MKNFLAAMALVSLTLILIACNFFYVNNTADTLLSLVDALPDAPDETSLAPAEEIRDFWRGKINTIGFSVGYTVLDRISEQAVSLVTAAEYRNFFDYQNARALLRDAVEDMRRLEQFSLGNLL